MEAVTIKDIARALNLSTSTVSRALRDSYEISAETKRLVMEYAGRINYQPNPVALSLKENRSRVIGVIVPQIANNFLSQAINGIEAIAYDCGYHVIVMQTHESLEREILTVQQAVARRVDGLLISISSQTTNVAHLQAIQQRNVPIVMFDRVSAEMDTPKIVADNFGGSFAATEHLIQTGRRRIAFVAIPPFMAITQDRLAGYRAALTQYGLPYEESLVDFVGFGEHELGPVIDKLLDLPNPPDAFFMAFDRLALGCMRALRNRNVSIPDQVSLIGFTNITVAELLDPPMSTVVQPAQEMGQIAAERLIELIELKQKAPAGLPNRPNLVSVPNQLFIRESTKR